jgi:hypothetical protein
MSVKFEDALEDTDYGLIICSKTGRLKGLWVPDGADEDHVPQSIVDICKENFGIDPNEDLVYH